VDFLTFVTLGTQGQDFNRLIKYVELGIQKGLIKDKVIVQAGQTEYKSDLVEIRSYIPKEEQDKLYEECDLLITHGGVGSIIGGLKHSKKIIAVARLKELGEHVNDHQLEILDTFIGSGYIMGADSEDSFIGSLEKIKKFKPKKYKSNTNNLIKMLDSFINK